MSILDDRTQQQVNQIEFAGKRVIVRDNEEAIIGAVLRGGLVVYQRVRDIVKSEMFGNVSYGEIWKAVEKLFERGLGIDVITVGDELERVYKLDSISNGMRAGRALLSDLRATGDPRHVESYAENIEDYHVKKQLEELGKMAVVWSANGRRAADIMADVSKTIGEIKLYSGRTKDHIYDLAQAVSEAYDETVNASRGLIKRVASGLIDLDEVLNGGYSGGQFILVAARPGQGKTALMLTETLNMIKAGRSVLFFSLEMTAREVAQRLIAQMSGIDVGRLQAGKLSQDEWKKHADAIEALSNMRDLLTVIDLPALRIGNLRQLIRRECAVKKIDIIMLDYIQLAKGDERAKDNRYLEIGEISKGLKALAKEMDVPILSAAQLGRDAEDKKPSLKDLRESGDLENDADIVVFIYRPDKDIKAAEIPVDLIVAKHRNGRTETIAAIYKSSITRFENGTRFIPQ